ncbi:MAG: hypothetical protein P9M08_07580 [Candidatus Erginobacter occultus]|nr:hypothetical protein [Candidatus Erginobacter occultus]
MIYQKRNVFRPLSQRWDLDQDNVKTVKEIIPEPGLLNQFFQILVGGDQKTNVHRLGLDFPHLPDLAFLENPEETDLELGGGPGNLVEK